ncbi:MAG: ribosomal L7Ae/L30e/S12e/Gadd45 family protein [Clostridia bacterium]|nr:ribosomal L7Ae/L30e/S12e/Gadd45 family protein [Clostridia bacterium]
MDNRFWGSLGLSSKAGKLIYGVPMIIEAMQKGKRVYLVIEAGDTSDNTHKKITDKCSFYGVEKIRIEADGAQLASRIGKSSSLAAVAITDESFYKMVSKNLVDNQ